MTTDNLTFAAHLSHIAIYSGLQVRCHFGRLQERARVASSSTWSKPRVYHTTIHGSFIYGDQRVSGVCAMMLQPVSIARQWNMRMSHDRCVSSLNLIGLLHRCA